MSLSRYGEFLAFAIVLIVIPGPDFAVVTKNTLIGGRRRGMWTSLGVANSNFVQGTAAAAGLSALILRVQPLFQAIKWAGVAYLVLLGVQAVRSAIRGEYPSLDGAEPGTQAGHRPARDACPAGQAQGPPHPRRHHRRRPDRLQRPPGHRARLKPFWAPG